MTRTLTYDYFTLLGSLTKYADGQKILSRCRIFTVFYHICDLKSRDDIIKALVTSLDYSLYFSNNTSESHSRIIIAKILVSGSNQIRSLAVNHLRHILQTTGTASFHKWAVQLLVDQLYDPVFEICTRSADVLEESFDNQANVEAAVACRPVISHLGNIGDQIGFMCLSSSVGFKYMKELGFIDSLIDDWFNVFCFNLV